MSNINGLNTNYNNNLYNTTSAKKTEINDETEKSSNDVTVQNETKGEYIVDEKTVNELLEQSRRQTEEAKVLFSKIFSNQANANGLAEGYDVMSSIEQSIRNYAETGSLDFEVSEEVSAQAREDVSEDGYYGVKQTSERILSFAKAISGGDPDKIEELRGAVDKAFSEVEEMFGGELPELSQNTYDAVMQGFDEWANPSQSE